MLAAAADVTPARLSDFLRHRNITTDKSERIKEATKKIGLIWDSFQKNIPGIKILVDTPEQLEKMYRGCQTVSAQDELCDALSELSASPLF